MTTESEIEPMSGGGWGIIPATVRRSKDLEPGAKILYCEISALSNLEMYCWASNAYFASIYDVDERTIKRWLESLKDAGFIEVVLDKKGFVTRRKIYTDMNLQKIVTKGQKCPPRGDKNVPTGGQKCPPNKISELDKPTTEKTAAVSSDGKKKKAKVPKVYPVLEPVEIPQHDKEEITRTYPEEDVAHAVKFSLLPSTVIKTCLAATIKWACKAKPDLTDPKGEVTQLLSRIPKEHYSSGINNQGIIEIIPLRGEGLIRFRQNEMTRLKEWLDEHKF